MVLRDFVKNFDDMSDQNGFSFKFKCDICGDGFLTKYREAPFAKAKSLLGAASSISSGLGGRLGGLGGSAWGQAPPQGTCKTQDGGKPTRKPSTKA